MIAALAVVVVSGGAVTAYAREELTAQPPQSRTVQLAELTGSGWRSSVFADYSDGATGKVGFADALQAAGGGTVSSSWTLIVQPVAAPERELPADAYVDVYRTQAIRPARLTSALLACALEARCVPLHSLPTGWRGSLSTDSAQTVVTVVAAQPGTVVSVSVNDSEAGKLHLSAARLRQVVTRLTVALARIGVASLAARSARPAS